MADQFGALALPAPVPAEDDGDGVTTAAAGDPCLDVLLDFLRAVLVADAGPAWNERAKAADEQPIVRSIFTHDPTQVEFTESDLPALYLWRRGDGSGFDDYAEDLLRDSETLTLWWVMPWAPDPDVQRRRSPIVNAVGKAIASACAAGRHPAWVLAADGATDPDAIRLSTTNTTSPVTWSGADLNGVVGGGSVFAPRPVTVMTSERPGGWNVVDPIEITGILGAGNGGAQHTEQIYLTNPDGEETVTGIWDFARVTSITRPAQPVPAGNLSVGYAASPEASLGSLVKRAAKLARLEVTGTPKLRNFRIELEDGTRDERVFYYVEMGLTIEEIEEPDLAAHYTNIGAAGGTGVFLTLFNEQGETTGTAQVPNA